MRTLPRREDPAPRRASGLAASLVMLVAVAALVVAGGLVAVTQWALELAG